MMPSVSVIIPVYNDTIRLQKCLDALAAQSFPPSAFEVIVVNNHPDQDLEPLINPSTLQLVLLNEPKPGSYAARNLALKHAKGEILVFTDSDCIPTVDWLSNGVDCLKKGQNIGVVAGAIHLFFKSESLTLTEVYEKYTAFNQKESVKHGYNTTANWFSYQKIIHEAGGFEEGLKSNGDSILSHKIYKMGYLITYCDGAAILHPSRDKLSAIINKRKRIIGGRYDFLKTQKSNLPYGLLKACFSFLRSNLKKASGIFKMDKSESIKFAWVVLILFLGIVLESFLLLLGKKSLR